MEKTGPPGDPAVRYTVEDGVAVLTLNRPHRKNAFTIPMVDAWADRLAAAGSDDSVGAIVVTGAGDSFCAGIDLDALAEIEATALARRSMLTDHVHRVALTLDRLDKPVIAAVRGAAVGAGMDMALMCDMRFASETMTMAASYVRLAVVPGDGGCYYLPRLVGPAKALELLLSGEPVGARDAERMGLVNRVYPDDLLLEETLDFARRLAAGPPMAIRLIKRTVYQSARTDLATALALAGSHMGVVMTMSDHAEGVAALREHRAATFTGE